MSDSVRASDRQSALRRLSLDGVTVTHIDELRVSANLRKKMGADTRIVILRQLAILIRAGVDLLEACETTAVGLEGEAGDKLREVCGALRRGEGLAAAFRAHLEGYPQYVYMMIDVGEASGKLEQVLGDSARQMDFEDRILKDMTSALTYPSFLILAGAAAVGFLFYEVVPRFGDMIGDGRERLTGLAALVIAAGEGLRGNSVLISTFLVGIGLGVLSSLSTQAGRARIYSVGHSIPIIRDLLIAKERAMWARVMSFALANGVALLDAADLATRSTRVGPFRNNLLNAIRRIRSGQRVDEAFGDPGVLSVMDLSLLRTGQRSGALAEMFGFIGDRYEENLRDALKRLTSLVEPMAIAIVALAVGAVAVGLVAAMSSVYDTVM